ncbi:kinesin-like protein Klp59C [Drosophila innubila]|uniref:kinesin-like protein Klp59C n=1 Tax=Drosophila innubila TaxID=198719 RepID=UPI00148DAEE8|nr:kinesin-like protein Klp59C [Drosophila innubila]
MEYLAIGDKINIRRSDGCIQSATVGLKSIERQIVTVEWTQGNKVKGKEITWSSVLELNPSLAKGKEKIMEMEPLKVELKPPSYNMYRKKSGNNSLKKRLRAAGRCDMVITPPSVKQAKPSGPPISNRAPTPFNRSSSSTVAPRSSVVREVERLKEQRERRRALQAEQRKELSALKSKDPNNPNWEVALMVGNYRDQLQMNPLRCLSPRGARVQQITVCVRKRPMSRRELQSKAVDIISVTNRGSLIVHELRNKVDLTKFLEHHKFRFDYTFDEACSNTLVYDHTARPLIRTMFEGGNATCFAYGQTGSGKTHTMGGEFCGKVQDCTTGIYALAARDVFNELNKPKSRELGASVTCSYFEIYGSKVFDLLLPDKPMLRVLEDGRQQVVIVGLTQVPVTKVEEVLGIIEQGNRERTSGQTSVNIKSSRSHAVFQMSLYMPGSCEPCGKCSFVDLAGNERGADTQSANLQTRREGAEINKSLLALKECIRALSRHSTHLPFRGSKLTQVLRDSFIGGEQNRTCMIAMISPSLTSVENTLNTLRYADRVKELVAKDDDFVDYDMPTADEEKSCEMDDDMQESSGFKDETESDSDDSENDVPDEPNGFVDFNSSQTSECHSSLNKCDSYQNISSEVENDIKTNAQTFELTDVIMQHDVLFDYVTNFNKDFEKIATETPSVKNIRLTKFLQESESHLRELEGIVKHTYNMVSNFNSQQYLECGGEDHIEENVEM